MKSIFRVTAVALTLACGVVEAAAHSFNVAVIAPLRGPNAEIGKQTFDGFLLAAKEADSHAGQESDGHLGGLDVYVSRVDLADQRNAVLAEVEALIGRVHFVVIAGAIPADVARALRSAAAGGQSLFIDVTGEPSPFAEAVTPPDAAGPATTSFAAAFQADTGTRPGRAAWRGYGAARLIDRAVRAVIGSMSDMPRLRVELEAAQVR